MAGFIKRLEDWRSGRRTCGAPDLLEMKSRVEWEALAWQLRRLAAQAVAAIAARPCGALPAEEDSDDETGALV